MQLPLCFLNFQLNWFQLKKNQLTLLVQRKLRFLKKEFPNDEIVFANGGDRNLENIPEMTEEGVQFLFGIGGNFKKNSSSSILDEWVDFIQKNKG